jgi:hypothetical protein
MMQVKGSYDRRGGHGLVVEPHALAPLCLQCRLQS